MRLANRTSNSDTDTIARYTAKPPTSSWTIGMVGRCSQCVLRITHKYGFVQPVKTTLEIPDPLFRRAKATAAQQGRSMKDYVVEALTEKLEGCGKNQGWRSVLGKLGREGKKAAKKVDSAIRAADFNQIDPEIWR